MSLVTTKMEPIAKWLNEQGVSAFILIYRTPKKRKDAFEDMQRAVRIVRSRASEWNIDPKRIGVMGSSAGGHLAARVSTGFDIQTYQTVDEHDRVSCKPDFTVLLYPAYMNKGKELSKDFTVSDELSPTQIITAKDDGFFPGSPIYANALKEAGASVRVHFFEKGGHGFSLRPKQYPLSTWPDLCLQWLRDENVIEVETKETNRDSLPPIQFVGGEKRFTAANQERVDLVRQIPGLVALWDFVQRRDSWKTNNPFISIPGESGGQTYELEPRNISRDFWHEGPQATLADFELFGRGPFGQAVRFSYPRSKAHLPVLTVSRKNLHDSPLDIKGKGKSVTLVVWLLYEKGSHAIAGMWHEGTVTPKGEPPVVKEPGKRQFGLFAGLQAHRGGVGAHISENGGSSFGNVYARHLAATPTKMKKFKPDMKPSETDSYWNAVGLVFHNEEDRVTAYLNGLAKEVWVENPKESRFFEHAYRAWQQGQLAAIDGIQPGEDANFPKDQYYRLPEDEPVETKIIERTSDRVVRLETYPFSKIEATYQVKPDGKLGKPLKRDLVALKSNPYYFGYDIYAPKTMEQGGPFTIGRVIHSNRHATLSAWIGGVAVFDRALSDEEMKKLAKIGNCSGAAQ